MSQRRDFKVIDEPVVSTERVLELYQETKSMLELFCSAMIDCWLERLGYLYKEIDG